MQEHSETYILDMLENVKADQEEQIYNADFTHGVSVLRLPIVGRVHFVRDFQGYMQAGFILLYWIYGVWCTYGVILLPRYADGTFSEGILIIYGFISTCVIIAFTRASLTNPGRVPLKTSTMPDDPDWEHCKVCNRNRPLRSHHCRRCKQCVLKMDHHCPWINNCVGEGNQWLFLQLLFWTFAMSATAFVLNILHTWHYPPCVSCDKESVFIRHEALFNIVSLLLSSLMTIASICLFCSQHIALVLEAFSYTHVNLLGVINFFIASLMMLGSWFVLVSQHCLVIQKAFSYTHPTAMGVINLFISSYMMLGSGILIIDQHLSIITDKTTIEIMKTIKSGPVKEPPKLQKSSYDAYRDLCGPVPMLMWPLPCRGRPRDLELQYPQFNV